MAKGMEIIDKEKDKSVISHPERYGGDTTYECIKVLEAWMPKEQYKGFLRGNAIKYLCRVGKKDETVQELKKAYEAGYCEHEIQTTKETLEKKQFISDMSGVPRFSEPKIPNIDNPFLGVIFYA